MPARHVDLLFNSLLGVRFTKWPGNSPGLDPDRPAEGDQVIRLLVQREETLAFN